MKQRTGPQETPHQVGGVIVQQTAIIQCDKYYDRNKNRVLWGFIGAKKGTSSG